jgi:beta-glucosidase
MKAVPFVPNLPLEPTRNATGEVAFPEGFLLGAATAAAQIEGGQVDGYEDSIWDAFARVPGATFLGHDLKTACDHYNRMPADVALLKELNLDSYRFSTSWARIQPGGRAFNPKGIDFYSRLVDELLGAGILPWLTLYHWDMPQAIQDEGGWPARDTAYRFADYAAHVHDALGDRVKVWTTLNEPWCSSYLSYIGGEHAPGHQNVAEGVAAAHHLLLAHGLAANAIKAADPSATVGITLNPTHTDPADPANPADVAAAIKDDGMRNRAFLDPIFAGAYADDVRGWLGEHLVAVEQPGDLEIISTPIDVLGINFYNGSCVGATPQELPDGSPMLTRTSGARPDLAQALAAGRTPANPTPNGEGVYGYRRDVPVTAMG